MLRCSSMRHRGLLFARDNIRDGRLFRSGWFTGASEFNLPAEGRVRRRGWSTAGGCEEARWVYAYDRLIMEIHTHTHISWHKIVAVESNRRRHRAPTNFPCAISSPAKPGVFELKSRCIVTFNSMCCTGYYLAVRGAQINWQTQQRRDDVHGRARARFLITYFRKPVIYFVFFIRASLKLAAEELKGKTK